MLGAIVGDIVGSVYEWHNISVKTFEPLFDERAFFTDDTILTVALAESLQTGLPYVQQLKTYYHRFPRRDYGTRFSRWAAHDSMEPYNSFGNGAAMRISPVGFAFDDLDIALQTAEEFTAVTHNHEEGIKGAKATVACIVLARQGKSKDEIKEYVEHQFGYNLGLHVDQIRPNYTFDESCQKTVPQAIRAFYDSETFEDAIRTAVSLGGDSDTLTCITGGIAEAFYGGVPEWIEAEVMSRLDERLATIVQSFRAKYPG